MSCGSCAAFVATATHKTCMRRVGTPLKGLDLSEQQLVDCGYNGKGMNDCNGAHVGAYQDFLANSGKAVSHEAQYPYQQRGKQQERGARKSIQRLKVTYHQTLQLFFA